MRSYFWGSTDARPLALFRIVFGAGLFFDSLDRLLDLRSLYSDQGLVSRATASLMCGASPLARLMGSPSASAAVLVGGALLSLAFAVGFYGRWCALLLWIYLNTLASRNCWATDGADAVMIILLGWAVFLDLDAAWSVRRLGRRFVPAWPVRLVEAQVALIYLSAGLSKSGPSWHHGRALFTVLQLNSFARPLGMTLTAWPLACTALTFATLAIELAFLPLALTPWGARFTRPVALVAAASLHLGILLLMRVGMFSYVMWAALCLFVPAAWLGGARPVERAPRAGRPAARVVGVLLAVQLLAIVVSLAWRSGRWAPLKAELGFLNLTQRWDMFAPDPPTDDVYWSARATLANGQSVDVLGDAPGMLAQTPFRFSRWYKVRDSMESSTALQVLLARYLCRQERDHAPVDVHLLLWHRPTYLPGEAPRTFTVAFDHVLRCSS